MRPTTRKPSLQSLFALPSISSLIFSSLSLSLCAAPAHGYIPAVPINDTSALNLTDSSTIDISWTGPPGVYGGRVSYQLEADIPTGGRTSGALVHFTESTMGPNVSTSTPWIAYVSCDVNETGASMEWDIFTLARDRGAVSALLYTATSHTCLLNQEYIQDFEKPLDVFATKTVQVARVIDNQWTHTNESFYYFNGTLLNESAIDINASLANDPPSYRSYLIGTLTARNSTGQATPTDIPNATSSAAQSNRQSTPGSMIALYVITGIISAAFILMVFVGARRALRHPERYGRREADDEQGPQSTAGGIAQAILDTFPVIKFSKGDGTESKRVSSEAHFEGIALPNMDPRRNRADESGEAGQRVKSYHTGSGSIESARDMSDDAEADAESIKPVASTSASTSRRTSAMEHPRSINGAATAAATTAIAAGSPVHAENPDQVSSDDQCPICLLDFETGDDLRVLPCEIGHVYHKACIDPWLLEVSSSCPLCRKDFNNPNATPAPATPSVAVPIDSTSPAQSALSPSPTSATASGSATTPPTQSGFARYLAFMRQGRRVRAGSESQHERGSGGYRRSRAGTGATALSVESSTVGRGRRREADQTGPGGY